MHVLPVIGWSAVSVLVVAWLFVSFAAPGPRREIVEWIGASAMYVALLSLFVHLFLRQEGTLGSVAFGFLAVFFSVGLVLCLWQTVASFRGPRTQVTSATN